MNSSIERYLKEIRTIVPSYEGARRGRGQCSLLSSLSSEDKKKFMNLENKIRLERNRICAKRNRDKKRSNLENLSEENKKLKYLVDKLTRENLSLKQRIEKLKKKVISVSNEKKEIGKIGKIEEIKDSLKFKDISDFDFFDFETEEPIVFDL